MNRIETLYSESAHPSHFINGYLSYLRELTYRMDVQAVSAFIELLSEARERGSQLFFIGNGGSAATASHFANDLAIGIRERPFRAISLCDNQAVLSAIANDLCFEEVFVQQLRALMQPGDVLVAISASGNSKNLLKAVQYATEKGGITVGITGFTGGRLRESVSLSLHLPCELREYGPAEDFHLVINHIVGNFFFMESKGIEGKQTLLPTKERARPSEVPHTLNS